MPLFFWTKKDFDAVMVMLTQILAQQQSNGTTLNRLLKQERDVMSALDDLQNQVRQNTDLEQSAITLIQGIAQKLQEAVNNNDSAALNQLAQQLQSSAAALGSAISANTAADPSGGGGAQPMAQRR